MSGDEKITGVCYFFLFNSSYLHFPIKFNLVSYFFLEQNQGTEEILQKYGSSFDFKKSDVHQTFSESINISYLREDTHLQKGYDMRIIVEKDNGNWAIYEEHRNEPIYTDGKKENTLRVAKYINETKGYDLVVIN